MTTLKTLRERHIPFASLRYTTEAFIDYCIPECAPKFNYALIGSGVSQNPDQPVSLRDLHGFQVGGVSMPHGKTNPPHLHFTCEVFICYRGRWKLMWGFDPGHESAEFGEGDIATVPTWIYRSFTNVGVDDGFMFTALGGDDNGGILWGPSTLRAAAEQGVHLTEDYRIIDERKGQRIEPGTRMLEPMTPAEIAGLRRWAPAQMARRIVRFADLQWSSEALLDSELPGRGGRMAAVIGLGMAQDRAIEAPVSNAHGLSIEWLSLPPGGSLSRHRLAEKQVMILKQGQVELSVEADDGELRQSLNGRQTEGWDSFAVPGNCWRSLRNTGADEALVLLLTSGDHRKRIEWDAAVTAAAGRLGRAIDANGYVGPKRFIDRSQR